MYQIQKLNIICLGQKMLSWSLPKASITLIKVGNLLVDLHHVCSLRALNEFKRLLHKGKARIVSVAHLSVRPICQ